jgi:hypothetical protein
MSVESRASTAMLARLLVEIGEDRRGLAKRLADAHEAQRRMHTHPSDAGALALAAVALHGWYTGVETIFERVARELDGDAGYVRTVRSGDHGGARHSAGRVAPVAPPAK